MKIQSDGNGGFNISKSIAYLTIVMMFLSMFAVVVSVTAYTVTNKNNIDTITNQVTDNIGRVDKNIVSIARIGPRLDNIESDISDIKIDVRFLVNKE